MGIVFNRALDRGHISWSKLLILSANPMLLILERIILARQSETNVLSTVPYHNTWLGIEQDILEKRPVYSVLSTGRSLIKEKLNPFPHTDAF